MTSPQIILASASPRRRELLAQIAVSFEVQAVDIEETCLPGELVPDCVERLSLEKARAALKMFPAAVVIGSDTMVVVDGDAWGKPKNRQDGLRMIECLSGRSHEVMTGVAVISTEREVSLLQRSIVTFRVLQRQEIEAYWETGEPQDKAGSYAIQGIAAQFIERLEGSYSGVMGLPLFETAQLLQQYGIDTLGRHSPVRSLP